MNKSNKISPGAVHAQKTNPSAHNSHQNEHQQSATTINKPQLNLPIQLQKNDHIQPAQHPSTLYTCRICLQQSPSLHANTQQQLSIMLQSLHEQEKLKQPKYVITTCKCQGTSGYVHQRCMIQWIDAQYKRSKEKQMKCEICLTEILYDRRVIPYFEITWKNLEEVSVCNVVCFASVVVVLAIFIILEIKANDLSLNDITRVTIFILIVVSVVVMGISMAVVVKEAFYKKRKQTIKIYSNDEIDICAISKDQLTHYERRSSTHRTQTNIRSMRSIRSMRDLQRRDQHRGENERNSHRQRSHRENTDVRQNHQQIQPPRSQRSIRNVRQPQSSRSIHVRSRQVIEAPSQN